MNTSESNHDMFNYKNMTLEELHVQQVRTTKYLEEARATWQLITAEEVTSEVKAGYQEMITTLELNLASILDELTNRNAK